MVFFPVASLLSAITIISRVKHGYRFAVVAKDLEHTFFQDVGRGCQDRAQKLSSNLGENVTCLFVGSPTGDSRHRQGNQTMIVEDLLANGNLDGMAIAVIDVTKGTHLIQKALGMGIPTITYNVDGSFGQMTCVGADSRAFAAEVGNNLLQAKPEGGKFVIVDRDSFVVKSQAGGARQALVQKGSWVEDTSVSPIDYEGKGNIAQQLMYEAVDKAPDITAIVSAGSYPVQSEYINGWQKLVRDQRFVNVTFVVVTRRPEAIELLKEGYIDALVGQQPFWKDWKPSISYSSFTVLELVWIHQRHFLMEPTSNHLSCHFWRLMHIYSRPRWRRTIWEALSLLVTASLE